MRNPLPLAALLLLATPARAQDRPGTSFHGQQSADTGPCATSASNFMSEQDVERLITDMLDRIDIRNRYLIVSCTRVENCQAMIYRGKPYILYNPVFLDEVKRLNFSTADLKVSTRNWEALAILAHELGHHVNNHLLNPHPDVSARDMELEADEFAGAMIFRMGGSRDEAMAAFRNLPPTGTYSHPGRQQRLDAVARGWERVKSRNTDPKPDPKPTPRTDTVATDPARIRPVTPDPNTDPVKPSHGTDTVATDPARSRPVTPDPRPDPVKPTPAPAGGRSYAAVRIGGQQWMAGNLDVDRFRNGDPIPEARTEAEWRQAVNARQPAWCHYLNDTANGTADGKLYNWYAVTDPRGLAPDGWHIPSDAEWTLLISGLGGATDALAKLKSGDGWYRGGNGNNLSGFSARPAGFRGLSGTFGKRGDEGCWWSASPGDSPGSARYMGIFRNMPSVSRTIGDPGVGFSVRCLRD